ncbi:MAG: carboxylesterase family protein, partial [Vicinamibacterales bacterium]|nr:carboxylesterase family protein [Vicinamibacterales bacterium]
MRGMQTVCRWSVLGTVLLATACGGETGTSEVPESASVPVVQTSAGQLEGAWADEAAGVSVFRGIAFAEPPVGDLRWRPPAPVESWEGTKTATQFGPACWQARNPEDSPYSR